MDYGVKVILVSSTISCRNWSLRRHPDYLDGTFKMKTNFISLILITAVALPLFSSAPLHSEQITEDALRTALKDHPEILIEFLKTHKSEVLQIINDAASESKVVQEQRSVEESLNNPLQARFPSRRGCEEAS